MNETLNNIINIMSNLPNLKDIWKRIAKNDLKTSIQKAADKTEELIKKESDDPCEEYFSRGFLNSLLKPLQELSIQILILKLQQVLTQDHYVEDHSYYSEAFLSFLIFELRNRNLEFGNTIATIRREQRISELFNKFEFLSNQLPQLSRNTISLIKRKEGHCYTLEQAEQEFLKNPTNQILSLEYFPFGFYDQNKRFKEYLKKGQTPIYIVGVSFEEAFFRVLSELSRLQKDGEISSKVLVVDDEEVWNQLRKDCLLSYIYVLKLQTEGLIFMPVGQTIFISNHSLSFSQQIQLPVFSKKRMIQRFFQLPSKEWISYKRLQEVARIIEDSEAQYEVIKRTNLFSTSKARPGWEQRIRIPQRALFPFLLNNWMDCDIEVINSKFLRQSEITQFWETVDILLRQPDPMLIKVFNATTKISSTKIVSLIETWVALSDSLDNLIKERFLMFCLEVIPNFNPSNGSIVFKSGLIKSLIYIQKLGKYPYSLDEIKNLVNSIIATYNVSEAYPSDFLKLIPLLMELDPDTIFCFFEEKIDNLNNIELSYLTDALSMMLRDSEYYKRAMDTIYKMASKGLYPNTWCNLLRFILCPWYQETGIHWHEVVDFAKEITKSNSKLAWEVIIQELPDYHSKPIFGQIAQMLLPVKQLETENVNHYWDICKSFSEICIKLAGFNGKRWAKIIDHQLVMQNFWGEFYSTLMESLLRMDDKAKLDVQLSLRFQLWKNRRFPDVQWAMPEEMCEKIETIMLSIKFDKPEYGFVYLFSSCENVWDPRFEKKVFIEEERSYPNSNQEIDNYIKEKMDLFTRQKYNRVELIRLIHQRCITENASVFQDTSLIFDSIGFDWNIFQALLQECTDENLGLLPNYFSFCIENDECEDSFLKAITSLRISQLSCSSQIKVIWHERFFTRIDFLRHVLTKEEFHSFINLREISFLFNLNYGNQVAIDLLNVFLREKANSNSFFSILNQLYKDEAISSVEVIRYLEEAKDSFSIKETKLNIYLSETFELLEKEYQFQFDKAEKIIKLEMKLVPTLVLRNSNSFVKQAMMNSPELYVTLISQIFKDENGNIANEVPRDEDYECCFQLYYGYTTCPGVMNNGLFSKELFMRWISEFETKMEEKKLLNCLDFSLGRLLAYAPKDKVMDLFPIDIVSDYLETAGSILLEPFGLEVINKRGAHIVDSYSTRLLADEYERYAKKHRELKRFRLSKVFYGLSKKFNDDASKEEDEYNE